MSEKAKAPVKAIDPVFADMVEYLRQSQLAAEADAAKKLMGAKIREHLGKIALEELAKTLPQVKKDYGVTSKQYIKIQRICASEDFIEALKLKKVEIVRFDHKSQNVNQDKSSIDQELAIEYLKELKSSEEFQAEYKDNDKMMKLMNHCIKKVEVLDEAALDDAINAGLIVPNDFQERCIKENIIVTIRVNKTKEK